MDREKVIKDGEETIKILGKIEEPTFWIDFVRNSVENMVHLLKEQQPKTGHWLKKMSKYPSAIAMGGSRISACDLCGGWGRKTFKYCPHCGAKMET